MDHVLIKVKGLRKKPYRKLISDYKLFETVDINVNYCVTYSPDHNLDEDTWFKVEQFSQQPYNLGIFNQPFDSKDYDDATKEQFSKISYLVSVQDQGFYFQKITPALFIRKKIIAFGESAKIEKSENRLVINTIPDAVYIKASDTLAFRNLATISSIFPGIDMLYKEATNEEVEDFLSEPFIELSNEYEAEKVSKPNRKRIALAMATLATMSSEDKVNMLTYIGGYCDQRLNFDQENNKFLISTDEELKHLLYGIEQRFYTTPFGHEKRLANSVQAL
ncbi:TPA: ATP F0F1 synthase synthase [Proteus mirabilis]|uniref:ATP F0F1 synthase synthase n=1 Tax=Morganellaceae TaxID=1903414 RepID=UPI001377F853|nr:MULTISPECIES: ATP F0F1 synthase synthase [Morganellaceae]EJD6080361.1 ATP F0F1 synthase synthase [Providencia rettgeri]EJD6600155.1 ATP F0F1 synthase synthase [Providencia rettgeri]ELA7721865.1 ATP F0F1 synthase synthase [Proteus mirabilis]ELA7787742.1 ATP F0F1 synthase synthase [Proteus mirabilis]ELB1216330.1 ATP F0F1 synthase synthase [Proteus mirabilis]